MASVAARRAGPWIALLVPLAGACSLLTRFDGVSGGGDDAPPGGPDAQAQDGAGDGGTTTDGALGGGDVESDAHTDADAALPNLQPNGGYELFTSGSGCGSEWGVFQGTDTRVTDARTGAYACRPCGTSSTDNNYSLNDGFSSGIMVAPGERYLAEAWVRLTDTSGQTVKGSIRIYHPTDSTVVQRVDPAPVALTMSWTRIEAIIDVTIAGRFNYYIQFNDGPLSSCALVDDVAIYRLR